MKLWRPYILLTIEVFDYSDYFEVLDNEKDSYIKLKDGKTTEDLRMIFRAYISIDMLLAFTNEECVKILVA